MPKSKYKRICKNSTCGNFLKNSWWDSEDHLLYVDVTGYSESYRRFFYKDIQSIILYKTSAGFWMTMVSALISMAAISLFLIETSITISLTWFVCSIPLFACLLKGPTGKLKVTTLSSAVTLSNGRYRKLKKLVRKISQRIVEVQGEFDAYTLLQQFADKVDPVASTAEEQPSVAASKTEHATPAELQEETPEVFRDSVEPAFNDTITSEINE